MTNTTVILIRSQGLGATAPEDEEFGREMMEKFLHVMEGRKERPAAICFYTEGVKLVAEGSPVVLGLRILAGSGVRLVACQSCIERYGLADRIAVGEVAGMPEIQRLLLEADKVVTI